jgi:hypothetical protein
LSSEPGVNRRPANSWPVVFLDNGRILEIATEAAWRSSS